MDALIAERVFGWSWEGEYLTPPRSHRCGVWRDGDTLVFTDVLPHYSTDIAAAWLVVEKLRADGCDFDMRIVATWTANFGLDMGLLSFSADAETAPLAICLAALLACPSATPRERGEA